jgi:hypothetical protein
MEVYWDLVHRFSFLFGDQWKLQSTSSILPFESYSIVLVWLKIHHSVYPNGGMGGISTIKYILAEL